MRSVLALLLALTLGTTCRAQTAAPSGPSSVATADVARLLGAWNCDGGIGGGSSTETYTRAGDTSVALGNSVRTSSGASGFVSETFSYSPSIAMWNVTGLPNGFFQGLRLSGPVWTPGSQWILAGTESFHNKSMPIRIVYTDLGRDSFRREHQVQAGGMWRDDAAYVCRRAGETLGVMPPSVASPVAFTPALGSAVKPSPVATTPPVGRSTATITRPWPFAPWRFAPAPSATAQGSNAEPRAPSTRSTSTSASPRVALAPKAMPTPTSEPTPTRKPTSAPKPIPAPKPTPATKSTSAPKPTSVPMKRRIVPTPKPTATAANRSAAAPQRHERVALAPAAPAQRDDRPYGLIGSWACRTTGGETSTQTYTLGNDGSIALRNALTLDGRRYEIDESYRFDPARNVWQNVTAGGAYRGRASPWRGATWTFDGIETEGRPSEVHMSYTTLGTTTFRREFARSRSGSWVPYLSEFCRRS